MRRLLTTIIAVTAISAATAQHHSLQEARLFAYSRTDQLIIGTCDIHADYDVVDTSRIAVDYKVSYRHGPDMHLEVRYKLLCGAKASLFYSVAQNYANMARYKDGWSEEELEEYYAAGDCTIVIPTEIYTTKEETRIRHNIPFADDVIYEYTLPASDIEWQLTEETCEIHGYTCTKACAGFEGRNWEVWFTLEVPISEGPWLLRGLPGLILRAEDSEGDFCFEMEGIAKHSEEIRLYRWSTKRITKRQWLKYERNALENPYSQFSQGGQVKFFNSNGMKELKDEWSLPYYPIYK